jgi:hypothetical protein
MGTSEVTGGSFSRRTFLRLAGPAAVGLGLEGDLATRIEAVERLGGLRPRQHDAETLAEERRLCYVGRATAIRDASVRARRGATPDSVA